MSEFGSFDSVFDGSERGSSNEENGEALSKKASNGTPNLNYEEKTIYVDEEGDSPPGLDELNDALRDQWMLQDICLEYQEDEDRYYFVISLARTRKASLFDFAE